jgi:hypothetical protein
MAAINCVEDHRTSVTLPGVSRTQYHWRSCTLLLLLQDESKLQPGAFYLDRSPQAKHLTLGGTHYSPQQAAELWGKLMQLAGLQEQAGSDTAAKEAPQQ